MVRLLLCLKFREKGPEMKQSAVVCFKNNSCRLDQPPEPFLMPLFCGVETALDLWLYLCFHVSISHSAWKFQQGF
jgi:hypothetical protein